MENVQTLGSILIIKYELTHILLYIKNEKFSILGLVYVKIGFPLNKQVLISASHTSNKLYYNPFYYVFRQYVK
jgi:hypothetical protein